MCFKYASCQGKSSDNKIFLKENYMLNSFMININLKNWDVFKHKFWVKSCF